MIKILLYLSCLFYAFNGITQVSVSLQTVFESGIDTLDSQQQEKFRTSLDKVLKKYISDIEIRGYCDDQGTAQANLKLSNRRANYIEGFMLANGFESENFVFTRGKGEIKTEPGQTNPDSLMASNRRVEVQIFYEPIQIFKHDIQPGERALVDGILFHGGRRFVLPESKPILQQLVLEMKNMPKHHFLIEGHVCCTRNGWDGTDTDTGQKNLSVVRAKYIYDYLVEHGIEEDRLEYEGKMGKIRTGKGDKFDRRVEILVTRIDS